MAREPNTFQERRTVIGKVKLETSTPATYYRHCGMANLCGMLMIKMRKLTDDLESEVVLSEQNITHQVTTTGFLPDPTSTGVKERERVASTSTS